MRISNLFEQQLLEHNVVNREAIASYVEDFAAACKHPNAQEWFRKTLARWLEKDDQINQPMGDQMPLNAPDWVDAAVARGDDLRIFHAPFHLNAAFEHLVDYFDWVTDEGEKFKAAKKAAERGETVEDEGLPPVMDDRNRVLKMTVEVAMRKADEWTKSDAKGALKTKVEDVEAVMEDGGYTWVTPLTLAALKRDGKILQNCIGTGTYDSEFKNKSYRFFFLHDRKGEPHVAISVEAKSMEISEAKGKQNQIPINRYVAVVANFINNKLDPEAAAKNYDIRNMGLALLSNGKLGHKAETGKVVMRIGDVRIFETEGVTSTISGGYGRENQTVGGGNDYSFVSPQDGPLFTINVGTNGKAWIKSYDDSVSLATKNRDLKLVTKFLNDHFDDAPAPLEVPHSSGSSNALQTFLNGDEVAYDYRVKRYGTAQETGKKVGQFEGHTCYLVGTHMSYSTVQTQVVVLGRDNAVADQFAVNEDSWSVGKSYSNLDQVPLNLRVKALNATGIKPRHDFDSDSDMKWRQESGTYYSLEKKLWGTFKETHKLLWSSKGFGVYRRLEVEDSPHLVFAKGTKQLLEISEGEKNWFKYLDEDLKHDDYQASAMPAPMRAAMLAALNGCEPFGKAFADTDLQALHIFHAGGKYVSRESISKPMHKFDDGSYVAVIDADGSKTYDFYASDDEVIFSLTLGKHTIETHQTSRRYMAASRNVQWLLNHLDFMGEDIVDAHGGYGGKGETKATLWNLGLFHDKRSDSWKLVQDGKVFFEGSNFRIVKFRNRYFFISESDGCVGYFKIDLNRVVDLHSLGDYGSRDLYKLLSEFLDKTDYLLPEDDYKRGERFKHGYFAHEHGKLAAIEDHFPTETVLELPKGFSWVRKAVDQSHEQEEKDQPVSGQRYSLVSKEGKTLMRATFDEGHLTQVRFSMESSVGHRETSTALKEMTPTQKKVFVMLLEKLNVKLLPTDARGLGYYRLKSGKYKAIKGNKALEGFLAGKIVFDNDIEFRCEYGGDWVLGHVDEEEEYYHDRFKPIIKVTLDDEGIESVKYSKREAKRNPKEYMPYLHKLIQIFHTVAGE